MSPLSLIETDNHDTPQMDTSTYLNSPIQTTPDLLPDLGTLHHEPMPDTSPLETLTRQQKRNLRNRQKGLARRDLQTAASFLQPGTVAVPISTNFLPPFNPSTVSAPPWWS
jgi:hypothetical protein